MIQRERTLSRKIGYGVGICICVLLLYSLGAPSTRDSSGQVSPGGKLAQLRAEYGLTEANLGEINAAGETIKLATLGLRGVAVNLLWERAHECKMKKDWTGLSATLQQLAKLQPRFISVWQFQAWNVSYNCSVEFDDYRDRYRWVIKGIQYLREGISYNQYEPRLLWDQGWFTGHKIGRADEKVQFRRLFRQDNDFHDSLPLELRDPTRDNWLCGKKCFQGVVQLHESGHKMKGKSPLLFYSDAPKCQINYAEAIVEEGTFDEVALEAWRRAAAEWRQYGKVLIETTFRDPRTGDILFIRLNDKDEDENYLAQAQKHIAALEALAPGLREKLRQQKLATLTKRERAALETPPAQRTAQEYELALAAERKIAVSHEELAQRIEGPHRPKALQLAREAKLAEQMADYIDRYRQIVNFEYWRLRCQVEQDPQTLQARKYIYQADKEALINLPQALENYQKGLAAWRKVLDTHPKLLEDRTTGEELVEVIDRYKEHLGRIGEPRLPPDFPLQDVLDRYGKKGS